MAATPRSEARAGLKLISPTAIYVIVLLALPLATVLVYSMMTGGRGNVSLPLTIANYAELWSKPVYGYILLKSLLVALSVTFITVVLAYPVAYFVSFHVKPDRKSLWLFLITIPFWTSYIIRVSLWFVILGYDGILDKALMSLGIMNTQLNFSSYGIPAIIFVLAHAYAPFAVLPIFVSLEKVDRSLLEAGQDLGESRWVTFLRVTLPLSMPGVIAAALIVFIPTVGDYVTPKLVGDGREPMIANFIETALLKLRNYPQGSAFAVVSMLMVGIVSVVFVLLNRRFIGGSK
ncbi:ABC transporter permease [Rhodobacter calidifons]|uniref:ABC transporter permease n=1 Tax=Rhodobacter calidifons TaxID=2715277 RepID=A0ABX0G9B1_9RHOB|nr:ABC transporter permease [Rhodobacter calidifons]NHB77473.1 ABC transporter permease [Rhodobacter calidifons]